jgi:hypothetical protein
VLILKVCSRAKLDVSNSVMMREEAELMFLKQLRLVENQLRFYAGGPTGEMIKDLLSEEGIAVDPINTSKWTRESL